jgi:hypothetical protein
VRKLITNANSQDVDIGLPQPASNHVELIEVVQWPNANPVIGLVID